MVAATAAAVAAVLWFVVTRGEDDVPISGVELGDDPRLLVITYPVGVGPCEAPSRISLEESSTTVTVRASTDKRIGRSCPAAARLEQKSVRLESDLGRRSVVDGLTGSRVRVQRPGS